MEHNELYFGPHSEWPQPSRIQRQNRTSGMAHRLMTLGAKLKRKTKLVILGATATAAVLVHCVLPTLL